MNPSANGWINKLLKTLENSNTLEEASNNAFYLALRESGFIYGNNVTIVENLLDKKDFTNEEICKTNLFLSLYFAYKKLDNSENFIDSIIEFYTQIEEYKTSYFKELLGEKKSTGLLEKIIHKRVLIEDNLISKSFNYFITNALLYIDVLAYKHYLRNKTITVNYIKNLESALETIVLCVLNAKQTKSEYDTSLIKLFEQSLRYQKKYNITYSQAISFIKSEFETQYIIDMACMATWTDASIDTKEHDFLNQLGTDLQLEQQTVNEAKASISLFFNTYKDQIVLLGSKNIVKTFYDNSSKMVSKLISRNSKRLYKELGESKELVMLISQSTVRDLSEEEQKKVQSQLLDIFKSIPSLAIFILPGGALLLPLVIKFIPKLLPSAFDDNRIEED
ncbi:LETM1-related biofilm-associated protein [Lacinutrix himadriensis]|uniref:LETM1-related biofilm-associated protein n=1 Tax=Lacinutrix himadriensis TaxID=641549 RepID=UPI0006E2C08B|nr:LETM1-related biofilm-associated protein [Lacinutrix himadriensis]